jgi:polyribonucleotide nucleotidyltransferase
MSHLFECEVGGRKLLVETGKLAGQAEGAVTVRYGDTVVLVTVCVSDEPREGVDFLPLTIDYEERLYAAGKIPGGFIRREGRPSQEAILACRLTDRPLRPLLPKEWRRDIQVIVTVLSADQENDPDILAVIGASAVLAMSQVPFAGPVGAVRVGYLDGELVLNPAMARLEDSQLDLVVVSTKEAVVMVEAGANEVSEDIVVQAIKFGHQANQAIIELQERLVAACGKPKAETPSAGVEPELEAQVTEILGERLDQALNKADKPQREQALGELKKELLERLGEAFPEKEIVSVFEAKMKAEVRANILERERRVSGRRLDEIRHISCELELLPRTHGSGLFTRERTQVLTITTLGSTRMEQQLDGLGIEEAKRFIHHYNFTPFSSGEVKRIGTPGRREIGHGALAERAILPVLPKHGDFPYTIRLVSEVLSSSGSTSMASVCASSLSLMDAGVPITRAVAGIAMGLITDDKGKCAILTDIEGIEDACGDMDFKIAGTTEGITALQMDIKLKGVGFDILERALAQARQARLVILDIMHSTIAVSRPEISRYAPRIYRLQINPDKIGTVIGPGGKTIRGITEETKATVDIDNNGTVLIGSPDEQSARRAIEMIENLTREVEVGEVYTGKVTRLMDFGAFVEVLPGKEGLVHISELADYRVARVEDEVKVGDEIMVKVVEVDRMGRVNLSRRAVLDDSPRPAGEGTKPGMSSGHKPSGYNKPRKPGGFQHDRGRSPDRRPPGRSSKRY